MVHIFFFWLHHGRSWWNDAKSRQKCIILQSLQVYWSLLLRSSLIVTANPWWRRQCVWHVGSSDYSTYFMAWDHHVVMVFCHGEGDRQSDTFVSNSHEGYNFIHCHVLPSWTFIAITHILCRFQSFIEICLQSYCMWGLLHCRLVEISLHSCICQGFGTASLAMYRGKGSCLSVFSNFWKCFRMGGDLLSPWQSKKNLASSFDSSCIPVGLIKTLLCWMMLDNIWCSQKLWARSDSWNK